MSRTLTGAAAERWLADEHARRFGGSVPMYCIYCGRELHGRTEELLGFCRCRDEGTDDAQAD